MVIARCDDETDGYTEEAKKLKKRYDETMKETSFVPYKDQNEMRKLKTKISGHILKLESHKKWLEDLLANDDKMALMNLTKLQSMPDSYR